LREVPRPYYLFFEIYTTWTPLFAIGSLLLFIFNNYNKV